MTVFWLFDGAFVRGLNQPLCRLHEEDMCCKASWRNVHGDDTGTIGCNEADLAEIENGICDVLRDGFMSELSPDFLPSGSNGLLQ